MVEPGGAQKAQEGRRRGQRRVSRAPFVVLTSRLALLTMASSHVFFGRHLIVLITNQNGLRIQTDKNINKHRTWKTKIEAIAQSVSRQLSPQRLLTVHPLTRISSALSSPTCLSSSLLLSRRTTSASRWRACLSTTPSSSSSRALLSVSPSYVLAPASIRAADTDAPGILISPDVAQSYYVGDAAGRPARVGHAKDHGDGDRKWADNLGLKFYTPEVGSILRSIAGGMIPAHRVFSSSADVLWRSAKRGPASVRRLPSSRPCYRSVSSSLQQ